MNGNSSARQDKEPAPALTKPDRFRRPSQVRTNPQAARQLSEQSGVQADNGNGRRPTRADMQRMRSLSPGGDKSRRDSGSPDTAGSLLSGAPPSQMEDEHELDEAADQDIEELWYRIHLIQASLSWF